MLTQHVSSFMMVKTGPQRVAVLDDQEKSRHKEEALSVQEYRRFKRCLRHRHRQEQPIDNNREGDQNAEHRHRGNMHPARDDCALFSGAFVVVSAGGIQSAM
jgi:hypothetical protein